MDTTVKNTIALLAVAMLGACGADNGSTGTTAATTPRVSAAATAPSNSDSRLPTLREVAARPQPALPIVTAEPVVQVFEPGKVTLSSPQLSVQVDRVTYTPYGMRIEATGRQHVEVTGGGLYVNFADKGVLSDDAGNTYRLRDPGLDLHTAVADKGDRWKLQLVANGFMPKDAHRLDLSLNMSQSSREALVHANWGVPAAWGDAREPVSDTVDAGHGWRFGTPPSANSPRGTASVRLFGVRWLEDGIEVDMEAINSERTGTIQLNSGPWSTRLVDDHGHVYRIVQPLSGDRSIRIGNGQRVAGRLLFAPQIAPDASRLRLLINGGPRGQDPWAPITAADDNLLAPRLAVAFDIPRGAMPELPAPSGQRSLNMEQAPLADTPLPTSTIDPVARLKRDLGASEQASGTLVELPGDVLFDFDKASLRPDAMPTLDKLAELIRRVGRPATVAGYTDDKGEDAYNKKLSLDRAMAVATALAERGVDRASLTVTGYGEADPKVPNRHADGSDNPQGRQRNRRVEVTIHRAATDD